MRRLVSLMTLVVSSGCGSADVRRADPPAPGGVPVVADTQTVDGVLHMRHDSTAFARARQWTIDTVPIVVYEDRGDSDFDLTYAYPPVLLSDGRMMAVAGIGSRLMLFKADGGPAKVLASAGEGPGELMRPTSPLLIPGDSVVVMDFAHRRANWFTAAEGLGKSDPIADLRGGCFAPAGVLPGRRILSYNQCLGGSERVAVAGRPPTAVITTGFDYRGVDTVAILPGFEMIVFETRFRGQRRDHLMALRLGRHPLAAVWDSSVATTTGEEGYVLERRTPDGSLTGTIEVAGPRRATTDAMRRAQIALELERLDGPRSERMVDAEESRRLAREVPFADSLPPYQSLIAGANSVLWAVDAQTLVDTMWAATAFRGDGAVVARLTGPGAGRPVLFETGRVLVREVDDDGVVRFAMYRMTVATSRGGPP